MTVRENYWQAIAPYINDPGATQIALQKAQQMGINSQDIADTFKAYGGEEFANVDASTVDSFTQANPQYGYQVSNGYVRPATSNAGGNPGYIQGNDSGGGGTPNMGPEGWAQLAQGNSDYINATQNSIFQNPNVYLPDGSSQTVSFGDMPNYAAYIQNNPDLLADFQSSNNPIKDIRAFGKYHWENHGQFENRQMPTATPSELGYLQPEVNIELSPEEQAIFDAEQRSRRQLANTGEQQLNRVNESFNSPTIQDRGELFDPSGYMDQSSLFDFSTDPTVGGFNQVRDDLIEREQDRFDRRRDSTENDLLVRGLNPGTEAWQARMDDLNRAENDFSLGATQIAGDEQNRLFNMQGQRRTMDLGEQELGYNMGRDWRQNQISEDSYFRNQPLNEYNSLMTGTQIQQPQFMGYQSTGFQGPDWAGAEQEGYNRNLYQQQRSDQKKQGWMQLGGSLLGAAGGAGGFGSLFGGG